MTREEPIDLEGKEIASSSWKVSFPTRKSGSAFLSNPHVNNGTSIHREGAEALQLALVAVHNYFWYIPSEKKCMKKITNVCK